MGTPAHKNPSSLHSHLLTCPLANRPTPAWNIQPFDITVIPLAAQPHSYGTARHALRFPHFACPNNYTTASVELPKKTLLHNAANVLLQKQCPANILHSLFYPVLLLGMLMQCVRAMMRCSHSASATPSERLHVHSKGFCCLAAAATRACQRYSP